MFSFLINLNLNLYSFFFVIFFPKAARRDPEASPMKETSFVITGMPPSGPEENQSETPGPDTVMTGASASPSPDAARRDEGVGAIQKDSVNLDRFNGNESPYSPRRRSVIDAKGVDVV